jgi:YtoQ family protein
MMKMKVAAARILLNSSGRLTSATSSRVFSSTAAAAGTSDKVWKIYLSGEIHSDWREVIAEGVAEKKLPVSLSSPNTSHEDSDDCGAIILGMEEERRNWDAIGASMNNLRTKTLIKDADVVVVRFGPKYRQCKCSFKLHEHVIYNVCAVVLRSI